MGATNNRGAICPDTSGPVDPSGTNNCMGGLGYNEPAKRNHDGQYSALHFLLLRYGNGLSSR
jgi:hypothetical protein